MASEKEKPKPSPEGEAKEAPKKSPMMKMIMMAGVLVVLEGGTVLVTMKMAGGPKRAVAEVPTTAPKEVVEQDVEVKLMEGKLPNTVSGRLYMVDLAVVAKVAEKDKAKAKTLFEERDAETRDRVRTIIASSDLKSLQEPGLETLRRQISYQLEQDIGKDLVKEVLIPRCTPMRAEY